MIYRWDFLKEKKPGSLGKTQTKDEGACCYPWLVSTFCSGREGAPRAGKQAVALRPNARESHHQQTKPTGRERGEGKGGEARARARNGMHPTRPPRAKSRQKAQTVSVRKAMGTIRRSSWLLRNKKLSAEKSENTGSRSSRGGEGRGGGHPSFSLAHFPGLRDSPSRRFGSCSTVLTESRHVTNTSPAPRK